MPILRSEEERKKIKNYLLNTDISYKRNKELAKELQEKYSININEKQIIAYKHLLGLKSNFKIGYVKCICQNCGREFYILNHKLKYEKHYFCSYKCSGENKSKQALKRNLEDVSELEIKQFIKKWNSFIKKNIMYEKGFLDFDYVYGLFLYHIPSIIRNTKSKNITGDYLKGYIRKSIKFKIWREKDNYKKVHFFNEIDNRLLGIE